MKNNETALEMCLRMLKERADHWYESGKDKFETGISSGYYSAASILEYAMEDNIYALRQLDWNHKEEEY